MRSDLDHLEMCRAVRDTLYFQNINKQTPCFGLFSRKSTGSPQHGLCGSRQRRGNPRTLRSRPPEGVLSCYYGSAAPLPHQVLYQGHFWRGMGWQWVRRRCSRIWGHQMTALQKQQFQEGEESSELDPSCRMHP